MSPSPVAGVDGARGRWLMATVHDRAAALTLHESFVDVLRDADRLGVDVVGVDMPIGLAADGHRPGDLEARALLGPRRSSLFPTPARAVLDAADYADALRRSRAASGKGLSKQAFNLVPMIRQVRGAITTADCDRVIEVHPESSFVQLAGAALESKKTAAGVGQRLRVLRPLVDDLDAVLGGAPAGCAVDDALDALVVAWSAARWAAGTARVFGDGLDPDGFPLRFVA